MELEEKVKKLVKEFPGLSKLLIKRTLCDDDVREDLTKARQKLQKFTKGPFLINPAAAADDKELEGNRYIPHLDGLSNIRNTLCEEGRQVNSCCSVMCELSFWPKLRRFENFLSLSFEE